MCIYAWEKAEEKVLAAKASLEASGNTGEINSEKALKNSEVNPSMPGVLELYILFKYAKASSEREWLGLLLWLTYYWNLSFTKSLVNEGSPLDADVLYNDV